MCVHMRYPCYLATLLVFLALWRDIQGSKTSATLLLPCYPAPLSQ